MKWQRQASDAKEHVLRESLSVNDIEHLQSDHAYAMHTIKVIFDRLKIDTDLLSDRMCPVQDPDGLVQILVLKTHVHDDQVLALRLAIAQAGLKMKAPALLVVPPAVLGEIKRRARLAQQGLLGEPVVLSTPRHVLFAVLDDLVAWALKADASDMHLTIQNHLPMADIAFSINGCCVRPSHFQSVTTQTLRELFSVAWMNVRGGNGAVFDPQREQQGRLDRSIQGQSIGLRWASLVTESGLTVCLRLLNRQGQQAVADLDSLGYSERQLESLRRATLLDGGLVVFAGMVGCGKSTTLASLIREIEPSRKIITLEDPVEYVIPNAHQCLVTGFDDVGASAERLIKLKTIKRSAAHDVLIGEVRDLEGGRAITDLVLSGANVYTTLHASSALQILLRLSSTLIGVPDSLLVMPGVVKLLVYQMLVRRLCPHCCCPTQQWLNIKPLQCALGRHRDQHWAKEWLACVLRQTGAASEQLRFRHTVGCTFCQDHASAASAGFSGRILIAEMIEPRATPLFYEALANHGLYRAVTQWQSELASQGVCELSGYEAVRQVAARLVCEGLIDPREFDNRFGVVR
jgi:type II secretory ATPase GspE/PulE/Tfp pilus assembly ATPase PilB-like protein